MRGQARSMEARPGQTERVPGLAGRQPGRRVVAAVREEGHRGLARVGDRRTKRLRRAAELVHGPPDAECRA